MSVIHNAIPKQIQDYIERAIFAKNFPWYYQAEANYGDGPLKNKLCSDTGATDPFQLAHMLYENGEVRSHFYREVLPLVSALPDATELLKIKVNLTTRHSKIGPFKYCLPHVDQTVPNGMTAVYYVHDSSGDTVLFNEHWPEDPSKYDFSKLTVAYRVRPTKGTLVVFPSSQIHAGNCPQTDDARVVINLNFVRGNVHG